MKDRLAKAEALNPEIHAFIRFTPELALEQAQGRRGAADGRHADAARSMASRSRTRTSTRPPASPPRRIRACWSDHVPKRRCRRRRAPGPRPARSCWASSPPMNSPGAGRPSTCPGRRRATPGTRTRFTAGSSSGTGAAVAAGVILGGTGSDTGGSIRGPAALCGMAGIKPTYGLCSRAACCRCRTALDTVGPLAWTVEDCAILLDALTGHDPADPSSAEPAEARPAVGPEWRREGAARSA